MCTVLGDRSWPVNGIVLGSAITLRSLPARGCLPCLSRLLAMPVTFSLWMMGVLIIRSLCFVLFLLGNIMLMLSRMILMLIALMGFLGGSLLAHLLNFSFVFPVG